MSNKKIAITGGIGSGKSTVSNILKELGFSVFSCDEIYKEIMESSEYIQQIQGLFPQVIIENRINKQKLAELVFSNEAYRQKLNAVAHPLIMKTLLEYMENTNGACVFAEVPLLFEEKLEHYFDEIWVVLRELDARIQSAMHRDKCDRESVLSRIKAQFDYEDKNTLTYLKSINAVIIENNKDKNTLKEQIKSFVQIDRETFFMKHKSS